MSMDDRLLEVLRQVAPGTALRPGLERILRANTGALVVLGSPPAVEALFTGGFQIDVPFTAQRLSELAKMDGAMVLDEHAARILWANVHLMPDPSIATVETGTRHRTAERVARQAGVPVISVSHSMRTITLYVEEWRHVLEDVGSVLSRANQAVATLEHYRARFDEASAALDARELHGQATLRDVLALLGRAELVCRVAGEPKPTASRCSRNRRIEISRPTWAAGTSGCSVCRRRVSTTAKRSPSVSTSSRRT